MWKCTMCPAALPSWSLVSSLMLKTDKLNIFFIIIPAAFISLYIYITFIFWICILFSRYRNGQILDLTNRTKYDGATLEKQSLVIRSVHREDTGRYSCVLENRIGASESKSTTLLTVLCKYFALHCDAQNLNLYIVRIRNSPFY